ncbi:MAG: Uncharacterised protein [Opitutia bacterium UBA7350]|nr:MAG: Uncharacterised protein [Opitutae bacterium UBA7350]
MFRKHSDEIPELRLTKWPFILGDLLLVAIALAIAILGNWQLTDWQVVACVLAVALGAALFVLPFMVEYFARQQENSSVTDHRTTVLANHVKALEARCAVMTDQITRLDQAQEVAPKEQKPRALDAAVLENLEARLDQQASQLKTIEETLDQLRRARVNDTTETPKNKVTAKPETKTTPKSEIRPPSEAKLEVKPKTKADPRAAKKTHGQLLKRAIHEKQDQATQAVDRIIESKSMETAQAHPTPKPQDKKPEPQKTEPIEPAEPVEQPEPLKTPTDKPLAAPEPAATLFTADAVPVTPAKTRSKKNEAHCIVNSLIGIGNKPYVRGSAGGLSWERGLVMEFEAIGKWRWTPPENLDAPIELQIYRNDEDPDTSGKHTLQPGKTLEINAKF